MQGHPLQTKHSAAGAITRPEGIWAAVYGAVCGGGRGRVCRDAVGGAGVGQAQTAVAVREGDLCSQRPVLMGQAQEGSIHGLAFCALSSLSHMLP
jgi:hypothetical protein